MATGTLRGPAGVTACSVLGLAGLSGISLTPERAGGRRQAGGQADADAGGDQCMTGDVVIELERHRRDVAGLRKELVDLFAELGHAVEGGEQPRLISELLEPHASASCQATGARDGDHQLLFSQGQHRQAP